LQRYFGQIRSLFNHGCIKTNYNQTNNQRKTKLLWQIWIDTVTAVIRSLLLDQDWIIHPEYVLKISFFKGSHISCVISIITLGKVKYNLKYTMRNCALWKNWLKHSWQKQDK
jgi:hypothetical protein